MREQRMCHIRLLDTRFGTAYNDIIMRLVT